MVVLRCTAKLLSRVGPAVANPGPSTTRLGDWFAKPVGIRHKRYLMLVSEWGRLPVVMPARDVKHMSRDFPDALGAVLRGLGVSHEEVEREVSASRDVVIAATNSRSLVGSLNDFAFLLRFYLRPDGSGDLVKAAVDLAHTPVGPLGMERPEDVARWLLR